MNWNECFKKFFELPFFYNDAKYAKSNISQQGIFTDCYNKSLREKLYNIPVPFHDILNIYIYNSIF